MEVGWSSFQSAQAFSKLICLVGALKTKISWSFRLESEKDACMSLHNE